MFRYNELCLSLLTTLMISFAGSAAADAQPAKVSPAPAAPAKAAPTPAKAPATPAPNPAVLQTTSLWRLFHTLKPPVVDVDGQIKPRQTLLAWLNAETPAAPANWNTPEFDDSTWLRTTACGGCQTPYLANQYLRGKFEVTDLSQVKDLTFTLVYCGGAVVYLNGKELTRKNLPAGQITATTLAEPYGLDSYLAASGDLLVGVHGGYLGPGRLAGPPDEDSRKRIAKRNRTIQDFPIPASTLRRGVNVLAIEIIRAPYHKVLLETTTEIGKNNRHNKFDWYICDLLEARLSAASEAGLVLSGTRPAGLQVWNSDPLSADANLDYADPCEPLRPIRLVGARNGTFSGKVMVASSKAIAGLKATAGELRGPATLPATAVRVRYGYVWGMESRSDGSIRSPYTQGVTFWGALGDAPPAEIAVGKPRPPAVGAAVEPIWVTVSVPKDAKPGLYQGDLRIEATGEKPVVVPLQLEVVDYTLPGAQNNVTLIEMIEVPDTLAVEYNLPLWSDRHWKMIAESFKLISDTGSRSIHISAIAHTNLGNAESMIRWIKKGENQYDFDFSVMDKYLDAAIANLGTPKIVVLQAWDLYLSTKESVGKRFSPELDERHAASQGGRPQVTFLDKATGRTENGTVPNLSDPSSKATWTKLINEVRRHLKERGLDQALMLGMFTDAVPPKEHIQFFQDIAPEVPWVQEGHGRWNSKIYTIAEIGFQASVWGIRFGDGQIQQYPSAKELPVESLYGWKQRRMDLAFERNPSLDGYPVTRWRFFAETGITGDLRGIGRLGADYWWALKGKDGRRVGPVGMRYPEGAWGGSGIQLNLCSSALAPGPDGPVATNRLVAFIEGVQECEARITIERVLTDQALKAKLPAELANRCQIVLDERLFNMWRTLSNYQLGGPYFFGAGAWRWAPGIPGQRWYLGSGWLDQSKQLYELAGQVQRLAGP